MRLRLADSTWNKHKAETSNTYGGLQFSDLITGLAKLLQHLVQLVLHGLPIDSLILKVLGRELDLRRSRDI